MEATRVGDHVPRQGGARDGRCFRGRSWRRLRRPRRVKGVFTVAWVPTGMKVGVSTSPCGVVRTPVRALPAREVTRKE